MTAPLDSELLQIDENFVNIYISTVMKFMTTLKSNYVQRKNRNDRTIIEHFRNNPKYTLGNAILNLNLNVRQENIQANLKAEFIKP